MNLVIRLNWLLGTLLLLGIFIIPVAGKIFGTASRGSVDNMLSQIISAQNSYYDQNDQYVLFGADEQDFVNAMIQLRLNAGDVGVLGFLYETFLREDGTLVIRARLDPTRFRDGPRSPDVYTYEKSRNGEVTRSWHGLSGKQLFFGLFES